jgi:hypothetical protein
VRRLDEERRARAEALLEDGLSPSTIAHKIGCSTRTIQRIQRRLYGIDAATAAEVYRDEAQSEEIRRAADDARAKKSRGRASTSAGLTWVWIGSVVACGVGGAILARRWRVTLPIDAGAQAFKAAAAHRAPNRTFAAAPLPELFDPNPTDDSEPFETRRAPGRNVYGTFSDAFPGAFESAPDRDAGC